MQQRIPLFFSPNVGNLDKQKDSPLEQARKTIDALIAYNMSLMSRLITDQQEMTEFFLSLYLGLDEIPAGVKFKFDQTVLKALKKSSIDEIIRDINLYEKIKLQFNKNDLDYVYLSISFTTKLLINPLLDGAFGKKILMILSNVFPPDQAKKKTKQITGYMSKRSNKLPMLVEYNILNDLLKTLAPQLSPLCNRLVDNIEIICDTSTVYAQLAKSECTRLSKKRDKYLNEYSDNPLLANLILSFCKLANNNMPKKVTDVFLGYIDLIDQMKQIYQLETQIDTLIRELTQKQKTEIFQAPVQNSSPENENTEFLSVEEEKLPQVKPLEAILETVTTEPFVIPTTESLETETITSLEPLPAIKSVIAEPVINLTEPVKTSQLTTRPQKAVRPVYIKENTEKVESEAAIKDVDVMKGEQSHEEPIYVYQPYYKQAEKKIQQQQYNTLNLKEDDIETCKKVFGLMPYESINLRALVNLTMKFGGKIETTGANRCRIIMQNIYAFISVPIEALERACNSATVTMHGGGHRSTRSQNNDSENAPDYLIEQFQQAFTRAGFTPVNLGLNIDKPQAAALR